MGHSSELRETPNAYTGHSCWDAQGAALLLSNVRERKNGTLIRYDSLRHLLNTLALIAFIVVLIIGGFAAYRNYGAPEEFDECVFYFAVAPFLVLAMWLLCRKLLDNYERRRFYSRDYQELTRRYFEKRGRLRRKPSNA